MKSRKTQRLTKLTDAQIKKSVEDFVRSGDYDGAVPDRNMDEWISEFADDVKAKVESGTPLQMALKESSSNMSAYVEEAEPEATVYYGDSEEPEVITQYRDDTDGDFQTKWHSTDPWRGYFDIVPSKDWKLVHTDCSLAYSQDEAELKQFDETLRKTLDKLGIKYARVFSRTSNVFSGGYDFFVEAGKADKVSGLVKLLAVKFRDPAKFQFTAMTGKDPSEATQDDKLFTKYAGELMSGKKSLSQIKKELESR